MFTFAYVLTTCKRKKVAYASKVRTFRYIYASQAMPTFVRIPKSSASRLSEDVWLIAEALNRYYKTNNLRVALESAVRITADRLESENEEFASILQKVREEGIDNDQ